MGICYSIDEDFNACEQNYRTRRKFKKANNHNSIIVEQKTIQESFIAELRNSFREDIHQTLNNFASQSSGINFGSVAEMSKEQLIALHKSLQLISHDGENFDHNEVITLCNLKTKNFLHTHKIKHELSKRFNEVSACPFNSNHTVQYDLWKIIPFENNQFYFYHPLTQTFLSLFQGNVGCGKEKFLWKIVDYGRRRNGGFIEIYHEQQNGQKLTISMTNNAGMLPDHRKLEATSENRIGNLWEIRFGQCDI